MSGARAGDDHSKGSLFDELDMLQRTNIMKTMTSPHKQSGNTGGVESSGDLSLESSNRLDLTHQLAAGERQGAPPGYARTLDDEADDDEFDELAEEDSEQHQQHMGSNALDDMNPHMQSAGRDRGSNRTSTTSATPTRNSNYHRSSAATESSGGGYSYNQEDRSQGSNRSKLCLMVGVLVVLLVGAAVALGVIFGTRSTSGGSAPRDVATDPNTLADNTDDFVIGGPGDIGGDLPGGDTGVLDPPAPEVPPPEPPVGTSPRFQDMFRVVAQISEGSTLLTTDSPQLRALNFLVDQDDLFLDPTSPELLPRYILLVLYESTGGDTWTRRSNWKQSSVCIWEQVTCDPVTRAVTKLFLQNNNLQGNIPREIGYLTTLDELSLYRNNLQGEIPDTIGLLSNLQSLYLQKNQLSGPIPPAIGSLSNLVNLLLNDNALQGELPTEMGTLFNLDELHLYNNNLYGSIPLEFGSMTRLDRMWLSSNRFSGPIPPIFSFMTNLRALYLDGNNFNGPIPSEIGSAVSLEDIRLYDNKLLSGSIPDSFVGLTNLTIFYVDGNELTGAIPAWVGQLANMKHMDMSRNNFNGDLPPGLGNLRQLIALSLSENELTGPILPQFGNLLQLERLNLDQNRLTGVVPATFDQLLNLAELKVEGNDLRGSVPIQVCNAGNNLTVTVDCDKITDCTCCPDCAVTAAARGSN